MSELTKQLREEYTWHDGQDDIVEPLIDPNVIALCDEHERIEAELAVSKKHGVLDVMRERDEARTALFKSQDELRRIEGLLRAWVNARGDDESEATKDLWAEGFRLAKAKP